MDTDGLVVSKLIKTKLMIVKHPLNVPPHVSAVLCTNRVSASGLYLALQSVDLSGQLHRVPAEVVHGDGVVPVAEVVFLT